MIERFTGFCLVWPQRQAPLSIAVLIGLTCVAMATQEPLAHEASTSGESSPNTPSTQFDPETLVGSHVDITLSTDDTITDAKVTKFVAGRERGTVRAVTIPDPRTGKPWTLGALRVKRIAPAGGRAFLVFDKKTKVLVPPKADDEKADADIAPPDAWPHLTDTQQKEAVDKERLLFKEISEKVSAHGLQSYETRRFLFYTDLPPQLVTTMYVPYLDKMYSKLCEAYGLDPETNIWRGKAVIVAYVDNRSFDQHEQAFYHSNFSSAQAQGLAHLGHGGPGSVVITCCVGHDPQTFAVTMVHETTHGFNYRYNYPIITGSACGSRTFSHDRSESNCL